MSTYQRAVRFVLPLALDLAIVLGSYALALYLRFDGEVPGESWRMLAWAGPLIAVAYILSYQTLGVYRTAWQYGSVRDALLLALAVAVVTAAVLTVNVLLPKRPIPLTVNVISAAFIFLATGVVRVSPRLWSSSATGWGDGDKPKERVLIVGAGDPGQLLAWELQHNRAQPYRAVAFIDDDPALHGKRIHGVPVVGGRGEIKQAISKYNISLVSLAQPPELAPRLQELLALCEPVPVRLVPSLQEVLEGRAARGEMREITMEDLLAREPLGIDEESCLGAIKGQVVLITGAAGSIGSELARRLLQFEPAAIHLLDTSETGLYELRGDLLRRAPESCAIKPWLSNITNLDKVSDIFAASRPQIVFHLAAYKHIGMMEEHPDQAFETNVLGTYNVFEAAQAVGARQVVFLSSHTAVNPVSTYGASKRIGELLVSSSAGSKTRLAAIRLTNVIDAGGAVLALFSRQIQAGGPVTVTHPEVARYFLTVNEVAGLILQAVTLSQGGEIFVLDVGEEVRIGELAERLIRARGMEPGKDIRINYLGLRPGEKLRESMIGDHERLESTAHPKVLTAVSELKFSGPELRAGIRELALDLRHRPGNLPARIHALARIDREEEPDPAAKLPAPSEEQEQEPRSAT
jgi:FlaA1/EpsC-like NDP-sugar epimerase